VLTAYASALVVGASGIGVALVAAGFGFGSLIVVPALALAAAIAERGTVRLTSSVEVSVALLPTLFTAVVFGPFAAMLVCAASMLGDFRRPYLKWLIYTASRGVTGAVSGLAASTVLWASTDRVSGIAFATVAGAVTMEALDLAFVSLTLRLRDTGESKNALKALGGVVAAALPLQAPVVALLAFVYEEISPWTLPLFLVPALAAQRLFVLYQEQRMLAEEVSAVNASLERASLSFATALVATLDARDRYTAGHSAAVAIYARDIAKRLGLTDAEQQLAHLTGLVHDIGKVGLPPGLLEKPGPLTLDERRQMEEHPSIGERILANVEDYETIAAIVRHHHERVDGAGYPDALRGDDIPLIARIIAVADAYNAMTSDRPYRDAMASRTARLRIAQAVESQFDTTVVAAFEAVLAGASEAYRLGTGPEFSLASRAWSPSSEEAPRLRLAVR
jgi:putative nucleotidyltransferase with HDIG domain